LAFRYRKFGVERKLSLGASPDVSLQQARKERDNAKLNLKTISTQRRKSANDA